MKLDNIQRELYSKIAIRHGITINKVQEIYSELFKYIKKEIESLDLRDMKSVDELQDLKVNFNLPGFSKMYMNKEQVIKYNKRKKNEAK